MGSVRNDFWKGFWNVFVFVIGLWVLVQAKGAIEMEWNGC